MRRLILAVILAVCSLTLAAQDDKFKVDYQGASPTIRDFGWSYLNSPDGLDTYLNEALAALQDAWILQLSGSALEEGKSLTIDEKNGFILYESRYEDSLFRIQMYFWNEADRKHKLFACGVYSYTEGKPDQGQYDGLDFYRYDNATKQMVRWRRDMGLGKDLDFEDGAFVTYDLPRTGKDIVKTIWYEDGPQRKTLKWDGRRFRK